MKLREFWIDRGIPEPNTGCLLWPGASTPQGYGRIMWNGKTKQLTHLSFETFNGPIPEGLFVLHKCDTPSCFNPAHLFLGTKRENRLDQIAKGRDPSKSATHCKRGHEIKGINKSIGRRRCRICAVEQTKLWRKGLKREMQRM
jgi:hypothetical protein